MRFHIHHYHHYDNDVTKLLGKIMTTLSELKVKADAVLAQVQQDTNINTAIAKVVDDYRSTISSLKQQLDEARANQNDPDALQQLSDTMDAVLKTDVANSKIVADKVTDNTVADQGPSPTPTPGTNPSSGA